MIPPKVLSSYGYILTLIQSLQRGGWVSGTATKISSHRPLLPFLQQIDETWDPINDCTSNSKFLPKVMVPTLSGDTVDSYFYDATRDGAKKVQLQKFASKCTCPVGKLLLSISGTTVLYFSGDGRWLQLEKKVLC